MTEGERATATGGVRRWLGAGVFAIAALTIWAYRSAPSGFFVRDDFMWLYDAAQQARNPAELFTWRPNNYFRPLSNVFFGAERLLFGLEPKGYFVVHLGVHVWNGVWVFVLGTALFRDPRAGLAAGLLFPVFERHAAATLWISDMVELVSVAALLPAAWAWLRCVRGDGARWYVAALLGAIAAVCAKESGAMVFPIFALIELRERGLAAWKERATWMRWAPLVAVGLVYVQIQSGFVRDAAAMPAHEGLWENARVAVPNLVANYPVLFNPVKVWVHDWRGPWIGVGAMLAGPALLALLRGRRGALDALLALGITLVGFLPFAIWFTRSDDLTGRYFYLAAVGGALSFGLVVAGLAERARGLGRFGPAPALALLVLVVGAHAKGTEKYARTNERYRESGWQTRVLVASLKRELAPAAESVSGERWAIVGAPVENPRHFQCMVALYTAVDYDDVGEERLDKTPALRREVLTRGAAPFLEAVGADRLLVWGQPGGLAPFGPEDSGNAAALWASATKNWRQTGRRGGGGLSWLRVLTVQL